MTTGIIIVSVIIAFALYDYFSTKNWQLVTSSTRNDTVFENRNKKYGAYQIRRDYNRRMLLILLGLTGGVGGLYGASLGIHTEIKKEKKHRIVAGPIQPLEEKPEVEEKPEKQKAVVKENPGTTLRFDAFKIVND